MVVVANRNAGAGTYVVVGIEVEVAGCARILMSLQVTSHQVVTISQPIGKKAAFGIEKQARGLGGAGGDNHDVSELLLQVTVSVEVGNASRAATVVGEHFLCSALGAQFAVPGVERNRDYGVLRAVLGVRFADITVAPPAAHTRPASVVGHAVARHGNVDRMQAKAFGGRL